MKLFFSYTMHDGFISKELMEKVYLCLAPSFDVFIDLIHNDSENKQERVLAELRQSHYIFVIKTPSIDKSLWVKLEMDEAARLNIPISYIDLTNRNNVIENADYIVQCVFDAII